MTRVDLPYLPCDGTEASVHFIITIVFTIMFGYCHPSPPPLQGPLLLWPSQCCSRQPQARPSRHGPPTRACSGPSCQSCVVWVHCSAGWQCGSHSGLSHCPSLAQPSSRTSSCGVGARKVGMISQEMSQCKGLSSYCVGVGMSCKAWCGS